MIIYAVIEWQFDGCNMFETALKHFFKKEDAESYMEKENLSNDKVSGVNYTIEEIEVE